MIDGDVWLTRLVSRRGLVQNQESFFSAFLIVPLALVGTFYGLPSFGLLFADIVDRGCCRGGGKLEFPS